MADLEFIKNWQKWSMGPYNVLSMKKDVAKACLVSLIYLY